MIVYVLKRLLWMTPVVLGVTFIVFTLLHFAPGDPASLVLGVEATDAQKAEWKAEQGLDKPFFVQFAAYVYDVVVDLDFGKSYNTNRPIITEIQQRLPKTLAVVLLSIALMQIVGIPIGIMSAVKQYSFGDNLAMILALIGVSMPTFWVGLMFSIFFSLNLRWLPASGLYGPEYFILPCVTLALAGIAMTARMTRSCMLDEIRKDYITTARAKGVSEQMVINRHALKNALIPVITQVGMAICILIGGAMVTEIVFSIPGMGTYMVNSIRGLDYPAVLGSVVVVAVFSSLVLLIVDLAYAFVDPRIRSQFASRKLFRRRANA